MDQKLCLFPCRRLTIFVTCLGGSAERKLHLKVRIERNTQQKLYSSTQAKNMTGETLVLTWEHVGIPEQSFYDEGT